LELWRKHFHDAKLIIFALQEKGRHEGRRSIGNRSFIMANAVNGINFSSSASHNCHVEERK
jgi:hypothetical protein